MQCSSASGSHLVLYVVRQSNRVTIKRQVYGADGRFIETTPPSQLPANEVVVLQPYGSLFFAAAPIFDAALPAATAESRSSVVILRLRERSDLGSTFIDLLRRYAESLQSVGSKLVVVSVNEQLADQLASPASSTSSAPKTCTARANASVQPRSAAYRDAVTWVAARDTEDPHEH